jgi:8-oxo-dGTP pyrophosphatase MutT (NUDIX family)
VSTPKLAVAVVVLLDDGRTLLVRRAPGRPAPGYWTPVTGKVEAGETLPAAAAREAQEETGLGVKIGKEVYRCLTEGAAFELVWYEARLTPGVSPDSLRRNEEIDDARWVTFAEALALAPMFPATAAFYASRAAETW